MGIESGYTPKGAEDFKASPEADENPENYARVVKTDDETTSYWINKVAADWEKMGAEEQASALNELRTIRNIQRGEQQNEPSSYARVMSYKTPAEYAQALQDPSLSQDVRMGLVDEMISLSR